MSFLTTRVSKSDVDDWGKFRRTLRFVPCTLKEKRAFGATNINEIFTRVDASYEVYHDMKIQTVVMISMGLCVTRFRSSKKKLNMKSSTESELVGASDYVPYNIWYIVFKHRQGYLNKSNNFPGQPKCH